MSVVASPPAPGLSETSDRHQAAQGGPPAPRPAYLPYADGMRVAAAAAVVLIHASPDPTAMRPGDPGFALAAVAFTATRWCVPIFFMLSGALLLDPARGDTPAEFVRKRFRRLGVPILCWSLIYLAWRIFVTKAISGSTGRILLEAARDLVHGRPGGHLWFAFALLGLYAATPILRLAWHPLPRATQVRVAAGLIGTWSLASLIWTAEGYLGWRVPPSPNVAIEWLPYLGYFLAGYLIRDFRPTQGQLAVCVLACVAISMASGAGLMVLIRAGQGWRAHGLFMCYLSPIVVLLGLAAYVVLAAIFRREAGPWLRQLGAASFGVYLSHGLVLDALRRAGVGRWDARPSLGIAGLYLATLGLSLALTLVAMRVPVLRRVVGE